MTEPAPTRTAAQNGLFNTIKRALLGYGDALDDTFAIGTGTVTGAANEGEGAGLFEVETAGILRFRSVVAGPNIDLVEAFGAVIVSFDPPPEHFHKAVPAGSTTSPTFATLDSANFVVSAGAYWVEATAITAGTSINQEYGTRISIDGVDFGTLVIRNNVADEDHCLAIVDEVILPAGPVLVELQGFADAGTLSAQRFTIHLRKK
jgi:hypothetical protein